VIHLYIAVVSEVDVVSAPGVVFVVSAVDVVAASEVVFVVLVSVVFEIADAVVLPVWNSTFPVSVFSIPVVVSGVWLDNLEHPIFSDLANIESCPTFSSLTVGGSTEYSGNSNCVRASCGYGNMFSNMGLW